MQNKRPRGNIRLGQKTYSIAIVGPGLVGQKILKTLHRRRFPIDSLDFFGRTERVIDIDGTDYLVRETRNESFDDIDIAFLSGTEGEKGASQQFGWEAVERGVIVIDNGDDFRMDDRVVLSVPEINSDALKRHQGFIANPNCTTIIANMVMWPIHNIIANIKRAFIVSNQSVSGSGKAGIDELKSQVISFANGKNCAIGNVNPHRIAFNVIPKIGSFVPLSQAYPENGYRTTEEQKIINETKKIFDDDEIKIESQCNRDPVFNGHFITINLQFDDFVDPGDVRTLMKISPGITLADDPLTELYPMPIMASGKNEVFVGRIRKDESVDYGVTMCCAGDNLLKGAALNAVQTAEALNRMGLL
jgi:aspartate-semialdehyde dehydrogenase